MEGSSQVNFTEVFSVFDVAVEGVEIRELVSILDSDLIKGTKVSAWPL